MYRLCFISALVVVSVFMIPLAACFDSDNDTGNGEIERIISLAPSNTEILFALGLDDRVVGVTEYCNFPPEAKEKAKVGGFSEVDMEKVISLSPDLIVAADLHKDSVVPELERRGMEVLTLAPKTLEEVLDGIKLLGQRTGKGKEANELVNDMETRIDAVKEKAGSLPEGEKPRFVTMVWHDPITVSGPQTLQGQLLEIAGGINIGYGLEHGPMGLETLIERDPEVIIANTGHGDSRDSILNWVKSEPRLRETQALKNDRVYQIDTDVFGRAGPRIVDALELIAQFLHPEIFDIVDMNRQ